MGVFERSFFQSQVLHTSEPNNSSQRARGGAAGKDFLVIIIRIYHRLGTRREIDSPITYQDPPILANELDIFPDLSRTELLSNRSEYAQRLAVLLSGICTKPVPQDLQRTSINKLFWVAQHQPASSIIYIDIWRGTLFFFGPAADAAAASTADAWESMETFRRNLIPPHATKSSSLEKVRVSLEQQQEINNNKKRKNNKGKSPIAKKPRRVYANHQNPNPPPNPK